MVLPWVECRQECAPWIGKRRDGDAYLEKHMCVDVAVGAFAHFAQIEIYAVGALVAHAPDGRHVALVASDASCALKTLLFALVSTCVCLALTMNESLYTAAC